MDFKAISATVDADFQRVNQFIGERLSSQVPLVKEIGNYIIQSGGKRLRPLVCVLSAKALGYQGDQHIDVATCVEFLHTATLLHDDVVDESDLRRGKASAHRVWGNAASVLVGDFLISRAFQMVVQVGNMQILHILSNATNLIAEGEVLQLVNCKNPDTTEAQYMEVIRYKTAKMFEAAAHSGAVLAQPGEALELAFARYADHLGCAFQLIDDVLDYSGDAATMGKNVGDDLAEGKPTLPLIYAMQHCPPDQVAMIRTAIQQGNTDQVAAITKAVQDCGAIDYTQTKAEQQATLAVEALVDVPDSEYKQALVAICHLAVHRNH